MKKIGWILSVLLTVLYAIPAYADDGAKVMRAFCNDQNALIYVRNAGEGGEISYQIGNTQCEDVTQGSLRDSGEGFRTLIMVDNSLSIKEENRDKEKQILKGIVDNHGENEAIRLATFSEEIEYLSDYSTDYKALSAVIDSISHYDQDTYLTDVIYDLFDDFEEDGFEGYIRVIILSDGVDNKPIGVTQDELYSRIKEFSCPIYTIGTRTKNNDSELESMFAMSRATGADYFILDDIDNPDEIVNELSKDNDISIFTAKLPESVKNGEKQNSQLTLSDGSSLTFEIRTPFGEGAETPKEEPEPVAEETGEPEKDGDVNDEAAEDASSEEGIQGKIIGFVKGHLIILICALAALILLIVILMLIKSAKARKKREAAEKDMSRFAHIEGKAPFEDAATEFVGSQSASDEGGTELIFGGKQTAKPTYRLTLTDKNDQSRVFECTFRDSAIIGRKSDMTDIAIDYDKSIGRRHCMINQKNGRFYVQDLGSTNQTKLNGKTVYNEEEIRNGDILTLGRVEMYVTII